MSKGFIKGSRTLDLHALSTIVDGILPILVLYQPEQIGVSVPIYFAARMLLNAAGAYLRFKTTTSVGGKTE
jgi:hypothetical protein